MKVLVTGGAGYVGSHTVYALRDQGHEIVVLDDLSSGFESALPPGVIFVRGDVADCALVQKICREHKVQGLLHFAAFVDANESVFEPLKYYTNNTVKSLELFSVCIAEGVNKIIFSSTAAVYGNPPSNDPVQETTPLRPVSPYGKSKAFAEQILKDLAMVHPELSFVILRYFNVAGSQAAGHIGQSTKGATHLIKVLAEVASGKRENVQVFGDDYPTQDGSCIRDYIHVDDIASAHVKALDYLIGGGASDTFNVGYGRGVSVFEAIQAFARVSGRPIPYVVAPRRAGDLVAVLADASKLQAQLSWQPRHQDLEFICRTALNWEKKISTSSRP